MTDFILPQRRVKFQLTSKRHPVALFGIGEIADIGRRAKTDPRAHRGKDDAAALIEGVSEGTMKLRVSVASSEIAMCLPQGTRLSGDMRGAWVQGHIECCLKDAVKELRGGAE